MGDAKGTEMGHRGHSTEHHLVTGGGGFVGFNLARALVKRGHKVTLLDVREPVYTMIDGMDFVKGDITRYEDVEAALEGKQCVYHIASFGMSGKEQLPKKRKLIENINVRGTHNVINGCIKQGVGRLVYTSTYNVVFGGQPIINGDESIPYLPLHKHTDHYGRTKCMADMAVMEANGKPLDSDQGILCTCTLRLAGVYGPGEQRYLPRIVGFLEKGLFAATYGQGGEPIVDFLHIENLVQAHVLAGEALQDSKNNIAAGQAYFLSDGKPVNNFEFFRPMVEGLGYKFPTLKIPFKLIMFIALVTQWLHTLIGGVYDFDPLLTPTEVYKTGVTHYFDIGKAKRELGYRPTKQNDLTEVVQWFKDHGRHRDSAKKTKFTDSMLFNILLVLIIAALIMSLLPMVK